MRSPDIFADDGDSEDSFDNFVSTPIRRRSEAIVTNEEESLNQDSVDGVSGNTQVTVIKNSNRNDTWLTEQDERFDEEEEEGDPDDTITRMLESSGDEEEAKDSPDDALSNLLKSFRDPSQPKSIERGEEEEEEDDASNLSIDIFGGSYDDSEKEKEDDETTERNKTLLPVDIPLQGQPPMKKLRPNPECLPSTSTAPPPLESSAVSGRHGPVGVVCGSTGEYWNQNKETIEIHGQNFVMNSYQDYMGMKITKLNHQVNQQVSKPIDKQSSLLKGYSVFVNGYTDPPALVIRDLMLAHGGEYHCYYMHGRTSYVLASSIATAKVKNIREKEIFITADWLTESIAAGKPLHYRDFLIYEKGAQEKGQMRQFLAATTSEAPTTTTSNGFLDARNPNFIRDYYARSRLHLISTLGQDMKDFVANLKMEGKMTEKCFDENELKQLGTSNNPMPTARGNNTVFHVDLDCFFVSVAVRDREDLKQKAVAITHSKGTISNSMSEVASCSYAARSCGVKNGMLVRDALQRCPQITLLPYQFDDYINVSRQIYQILASYTLELRAVSCDEMYINVSTICQHYGIEDPTLLAEHIRNVIRTNTQCPASVGIGSTSLLARLATRHAKPDGVFWVTEEKKEAFMVAEKIKDLPGLGYQMMDRVTAMLGDISSCGQLQQRTERELVQVFGPKHAAKVFKQCRGTEEDPEDFWKTHIRKSVSCDINYGIRFTKKEELVQLMTAIGAELERKLTDCKMSAGSITLKLMVRSADAPLETAKFMGHGRCDTYTKTSNLTMSTVRGDTLTAEAMKLYVKVSPKIGDLRGVGVICGKLKSKTRKNALTAVQQMFGIAKKDEKKEETEEITASKRQATRQDSPEEDADDDEEMRRRFIEQPQHGANSNQKEQDILHPKDLKPGKHVIVPEMLKMSEVRIRRAMGRFDDEQIEEMMKKLDRVLREAPTRKTAQELQSTLASLLSSGKLLTFEKFLSKFDELSTDSQRSHLDWFPTFHIMLGNLKEETRDLLGFPIDSIEARVAKYGKVTKTRSAPKRFIPLEIHVIDSTNRSDFN